MFVSSASRERAAGRASMELIAYHVQRAIEGPDGENSLARDVEAIRKEYGDPKHPFAANQTIIDRLKALGMRL